MLYTLKYQRFTTYGCRDREFKKLVFVIDAHLLCAKWDLNSPRFSCCLKFILGFMTFQTSDCTLTNIYVELDNITETDLSQIWPVLAWAIKYWPSPALAVYIYLSDVSIVFLLMSSSGGVSIFLVFRGNKC